MKKLTAYNPDNNRQIEQTVGKAMCAYANWQEAEESARDGEEYAGGISAVEMACMRNAEYEATVRCIAMFVKEPVSTICAYVIDRCKDEFGI